MQKIKKTHLVILERNMSHMHGQTDRWKDEKD